jgi:hypothetical protein
MTEILPALLTPLVAVITTYIAYQQYRIRRDERALALYDRRLAVFKSAVSILDRVRACEHMTASDSLAWLSSVAEAPFLFGEEVQAVIEPLFGAVHDYAITVEPVSKTKDFNTACAEAALHVEEYRNPLMEVFTPYLRPAGSPTRRKRRISLKQVSKLLPPEPTCEHLDKELGEDIPF